MDRNRPSSGKNYNMKQPRFSIHDAFEEENDEAIRVLGSTVVSTVGRPSTANNSNTNMPNNAQNEMATLTTCDPRLVSIKSICHIALNLPTWNIFLSLSHYPSRRVSKFGGGSSNNGEGGASVGGGGGGGGGDDTTSRDSDSLIQEYINMPPTEMYTHCWNHPKIRENWRTVLAAVLLLVIGIVLVTMGIFAIANPANGSQGFVFLLAGNLQIPSTRVPVTEDLIDDFHSILSFLARFHLLHTGCLSRSVYMACSYRLSRLQFLPSAFIYIVIESNCNKMNTIIILTRIRVIELGSWKRVYVLRLRLLNE